VLEAGAWPFTPPRPVLQLDCDGRAWRVWVWVCCRAYFLSNWNVFDLLIVAATNAGGSPWGVHTMRARRHHSHKDRREHMHTRPQSLCTICHRREGRL
jgi:hypothetical protein